MILFLLAALTGCVEYQWAPEDDEVDARAVLRVGPDAIDFGEALKGTTAETSLTLSNVGSALLEIHAFSIDNSVFSLPVDEAPWALEIGESRDLTVEWTATEALDQGWVTIQSTDRAQPFITVELLGRSLAPVLAVRPDPLNFGMQRIYVDAWSFASVHNIGTDVLTVASAHIQGPFEVDTSSLPIVLNPGEQAPLRVGYHPKTVDDQGWLTVDSPTGGRVSVPLLGQAAWPTLEVTPAPIAFEKGVACNLPKQELTLKNTGAVDLTVTQVDLPSDMRMWGSPPFFLPPQGEMALSVGMTAATPWMDDVVVFQSNDPAGPLSVSVTSGQLEGLLVATDVALGPHGSSCPLSPFVEVQNVGTACMTLTGMQLPAGVATDYVFPRTLVHGQTAHIRLNVATADVIDEVGFVLHDGQGGPVPFHVAHGDAPELMLDPPAVTLSQEVECGIGTRFSLVATGEGCIDVTGFVLPPGVAFAPWSRPAPFTLSEGDIQPLTLLRADFNATLPASLTIETSQGPVVLPIEGAPANSPIVVVTDAELGPAPNGCRLSEPVQIANQGPGCVRIDGVDLPAGVSTSRAFPMYLAAGDTRLMNIIQEAPVRTAVNESAMLHFGGSLASVDFEISNNGVPPTVVVSPSVIELGVLEDGTSSCSVLPKEFTLTGSGEGCVAITGFELPPGAAFARWSRPAPFTLTDGQAQVLTLTRTNGVHRIDGVGHVDSSGGREPFAVRLNAGPMTLEINPSPVDFGEVSPLCDAQEPVELSVTGDGCMVINDITNPAGVGAWLSSRYLRSGDVVSAVFSLQAGWAPLSDYTTYHTSHGDFDVDLIAGELNDLFAVVDDYQQPIANMADIMFWIDQSCSMEGDANHLASQIGVFTDTLDALATDFQLMIVHSDTGCRLGPIWADGDVDIPAEFGVLTHHSSQGESGLSTTLRAFQKSVPGACNEGFLRDGAARSVVLISDEPEQSSASWSALLRDIELVGGATAIHAVAAETTGPCGAKRGDGYIEAAQATGGEFLSICGTWGDDLDLIAQSTSFPRNSYLLSKDPLVSTIEVDVDGTLVFDWTYDAVRNGIVFDPGFVPGAGSAIQLRYDSREPTCY